MSNKNNKQDDEWTVVKKKEEKKPKDEVDPKTKMTKAQLQSFIDKMPKLKTMSGLKQSETIYDAFLATVKKPAPSKEPEKGLLKNGVAQNGNLNKKSTKPKKKRDDKKKVVDKPPKNLEEALDKIDVTELKDLMKATMLRFGESPSLWLKDLECYLNVKLNFTLSDPTYAGNPEDYPLCALPKKIVDIIESVFARCNKHTLLLFFERLITEMLENMQKGIRTNGNRILIQALARDNPAFISNSLQKFADLRNTYQDRYPVCVSIFWVVGQAGVVDFEAGIKVWMELMLPFLGVKEYSKYIVDYLQNLLDWHPATSFAEYIGVYEFFPIMDTCFINSSVLPANLQRDLMKLYPKIKSHSFGAEPLTFFPSFLARLTPDTPSNLKAELLSCLVHCLVTDEQCFGAWRQMYPKHILHSSILLEHLLHKWKSQGHSLARAPFKETLEKFSATNQQLTTKDLKGHPGLAKSNYSCTELLNKMHTPTNIPWRLMIFVVLSALSCVFIYDCQLHGSITSSKTVTFLRDAGVIAAGYQAWVSTKQYSYSSYLWIEKNVPIFYASFCSSAGPYLTTVVDSLTLFRTSLMSKLILAYDTVVQYIPRLLKWIDDTFPGYLEMVGAYVTQAGSLILDVSQKAWVHIARCSLLAGAWLAENVFTGELAVDKLQQHALVAVDTLQTYAVNAFQWVNQQLSSN